MGAGRKEVRLAISMTRSPFPRPLPSLHGFLQQMLSWFGGPLPGPPLVNIFPVILQSADTSRRYEAARCTPPVLPLVILL